MGWKRFVGCAIIALALNSYFKFFSLPELSLIGEHPLPQSQFEQINGVWVTEVDSDALSSPQKIDETCQRAKNLGFNTVYFSVIEHGQIMYPSYASSQLEPSIINSDFGNWDMPDAVVKACHKRNMRAVAWMQSGLTIPVQSSFGRLIAKNKWQLVTERGETAFVTHGLANYVLDISVPEVRQFYKKIIEELLNRGVDGIQIDDNFGIPETPTVISTSQLQKSIKQGRDLDWGKVSRVQAVFSSKTLSTEFNRIVAEIARSDPKEADNWNLVVKQQNGLWRLLPLNDYIRELSEHVSRTSGQKAIFSCSLNPLLNATHTTNYHYPQWLVERKVCDELSVQMFSRDGERTKLNIQSELATSYLRNPGTAKVSIALLTGTMDDMKRNTIDAKSLKGVIQYVSELNVNYGTNSRQTIGTNLFFFESVRKILPKGLPTKKK